MYESFFGFKEKPFNLTPDPRFLYLSEKHREALAHLFYGIKERKGFVVLSGEVGTGKTTLVRALLDRFNQDFQIAYVSKPGISIEDFFEAVYQEFNLHVNGDSKADYLTKLHDFLLESHRHSKTTALIIDEAQNLDTPLLTEIRMLTNLETSTEKLLQVFLVGQPELNDQLERPELWHLKQRVSIRYHLLPLDRRETGEYIQTRLRIAGAEHLNYFTEGAIQKIYKYSGGVPRLINNICDNSLLTAFSMGKPVINERIVREGVADLRLERGYKDSRARGRAQKDVSVWHSPVFAALLTVLIALLSVGIILVLPGKGDAPQRLLKPFETIYSFFGGKQEREAKISRSTEREIIGDRKTATEVLAELKTEIPPDSPIARTGDTRLILEQEGQQEAIDTLLEVEEESRSVSLYGTPISEPSAEVIAQGETLETGPTPDEPIQGEEKILIELRETMARFPAKTSGETFKEPEQSSSDRLVVDSDDLEERSAKAREGQVETAHKPPIRGYFLDSLELANPGGESLTGALDTKVLEGAGEESLGEPEERSLKKEGEKGADRVASKEEVKQLLANYIERYNRKDIDGFLSLFSPKAVQNRTDRFKRIQKIYSGFFDQSQEIQYHLENTRITYYQNAVTARARYEIDQILKENGKKKVWRGEIRWILVRENGALRIRYLEYTPEKSQMGKSTKDKTGTITKEKSR